MRLWLAPVTADMNIKVLVNLKSQPRRHPDTLLFTLIHLMYQMIHFLYRKLKKNNSTWKFFSNLTFIFYWYCNYKQIRWRYTCSTFYQYSRWYLNYKQIRWQYTNNTYFRTPSTGTWTANKSNGSIPVLQF